MSKPSKWSSAKKAPKSEFQALLCGSSKPILEQWKAEANGTQHPPWAPKPHHTQRFSDEELTYMAKIKALNEMSEYIYSRNLKLKYRLNAVAKEIKCLKRVKRCLSRRLFEHNSKELIGTFLEIPDSETSTITMDQIIGDVVNTATQSKIAPTPVVKKKRKDQQKMPQNTKSSPIPNTSIYSKEDEINQHIISVIDNVANTSYKSSNGPSSAKKPRKQNLAALTSPTKDTLIFTNGSNNGTSLNNNTFASHNSLPIKMEMSSPPTTYVAKQPSSTFVVQNKDFTAPTHLPIYVKRELLCPPERRDQSNIISSSSTDIPAAYSIQSGSSNTFVTTSNSMSNLQTLLTTSSKTDSYTSNGQHSTESSSYFPSKQMEINKTPDIATNSMTSKVYYSNKFNDDRVPSYGTSALTRENLKSLAQSRLNANSGQMTPQSELCTAPIQSLANSNV